MSIPLPIKTPLIPPVTLCITTIAIALLLIPHHHATSQPQLDTITSGTATIQQEATTTTITQTSHSTTLNWNSYNINQGHTITYNQPSTSSIAINNIKDTNPSQILGNINANGRIILLNPNGFYIGPNSTISANTFIAAAANLQQTTYNQNTNTLTLNNPQQTLTGDITLHGTITTTNTTQLIAHHINQNTQATITATNHIALKATHTISLHATHTTTANNSSIDLFANQTITGGGSTNTTNTTITTSYLSLTGDYTATNTTSLTADTILLNHQATITSPTTTIHSTQQSLISATIQSPNTQNPNTQNPNTQNPNTQGSTTITSDGTITLLNATITTPQQDITIGSTTTPPTQITINQNTTIDTSHPTNPGTIIIYATNTALHGTILANAITGTGGFIEVSATNHLTFNPTLIQATSTYGTPGTVFIDPDNIIITDNPPPPTALSLFTSFTAANPGTTITGLGDAIATTDTHVLIGNINSNGFRGNAYLYNIATETWTDLSTTPGNPITSLGGISNFGVSVALNDTYALIGDTGASSFRGDAFLYRLDGTNVFTSNCATTGTPISAWCTLSDTPDEPITSLANSNFGISVALNDTYALIGAFGVSTFRGDAYLYRLDGSDAFTSNCATTGTSTSPWCTLSESTDEPVTSLAANFLFSISVALNTTYALIGAEGISGSTGDAYLYRLDGSDAFTSNCATTGTPTSPLTSPWCTLSDTPDEPITSLPVSSSFGRSVALNDTYALIGARRVSSNRGDAYLYRLDGTNVFTSNCATTGTSTSPWCTLSRSTDQPITSLANQSFFGTSVALNDTYALIGARQVSLNRGEAYLYRLDGTNAFNSSCQSAGTATTPWCAIVADAGLSLINNSITSGDDNTGSLFGASVALSNTTIVIGATRTTEAAQGNAFLILSGIIDTTTTFFTPTQVQTMLSTNNVTIMANNDITILSSFTYTGTNTLTLTSMGTINANPLGLATTTTLPTITVPTLTINASGNVGSTTLPLSPISTSLTINAGTNSVFLTHSTNILASLPTGSGGSAGSLFLTQLNGDITLPVSINIATTNLTLTASAGSILTTVPITTEPLITAGNITFNASGNIGSSTNPLFLSSSGTLTLTAGTINSIFLAHPSDVSIYLPLTATAGSLSLTQTTGAINITSAINLPTTNLTLNAPTGAITTNLTTTAITSADLTLTAAGNIGSSDNPIALTSTGTLTINAGTNSVFLAHPSDAFAYLSATITSSSLSLFQATGDITITSPINLPTTNLTLNAPTGAIITNLTTTAITANNLTLTAAGNIGSSTNPFIFTTTGALTINAGTNSVFLAHPSDVSIYLPLTGTAGSLSLVQTTGAITITSAINLPTTNLTLNAPTGAITTNLTTTAITANNLTLTAAGNIGLSTNPFIFTTTGALTINAGTNSVFLAHPSDVSIYLPLTGTAGSLSLTQTTEAINITSAINLPTTNLTLTATEGAILTNLTTIAITSADLTLTAAGNIGSADNPIALTSTGTLIINAGTNSVFLAHPSDAFAYLSATITSSSLSLFQATGDITITSPINLPTTNLTLNAPTGAILTTLTTTAITANNLTLSAAGNIGSSSRPFILTTTGALTINAGANSVFLAHPSDVSIYLPLTGTAGSLSLVQTTGAITITSAINLPTTNLTLNATAGAITTNLTTTAITANNLTLTAAGNIGSSTNPFILTTTGSLTINAGANSVFLAHPSDVSIYLPLTGTAGTLSLTQTTGAINITDPITLTGANLTLDATEGAILTTLTTTAITAADLTLTAAGNIGSSDNPIALTSTGTLTINAGTNSVFLAHPSDAFAYLSATITSSSLSLFQATGDITITSPINLPATNLTLNAPTGAIITTLTTTAITANNLTLSAAGNIGSSSRPFILTTTGALTINAGTNSVFLAHPSDVSIYLPLTVTAGSLSLTQTTGAINITSAINLPTTNLTLDATTGAIATNLTTTAITANNLTLTAAGNIGSSTNPFILTTTGSLTINAGTNSVFLAHPSDVSIYLPLTGTAGTLSLTQTTRAINITSAINLPTTNLTLDATEGAILTTLTTTAITAADLTLTAAGNIGSSDNPIALTSTGTLTINAGTNSVFLAHPSDAFAYLSATITSSSLSLFQATGDITITSPINLPATNLTLNATAGSILTTLTTTAITAADLTLTAAGNIGSFTNPFILTTTGALTINAGANSVFLAHPSDVSIYLPLTGTAGSLSLVQTTGAITITSAINLPTTNLTLNATAGAITTNLTTTAITANNLTLTAAGNIGSSTNPFILTTTGSLTINAGANSVFLAHPSDVSIYLPLTGTAGTLSLTQTTGAINITDPITLTGANLTLDATEGAILTNLTATAITAADLTLTAAGNIGSSDNPIALTSTGTLTINAGTNSVFLAHPSDAFAYLSATITSSSLSLFQATGAINITSAINLPTTNLTLNAPAGAITTNLTATAITAADLTLTAAGNIGSSDNPIALTSTGTLTINAGTNSVFLAHPSDAFAYLSATITSSSLSLFQATGAINITSAINLPTTNLILTATAGAILTTLTTTAITANNLTLIASGNIGSSSRPFILTTTGSLTINAGTNSVFLAHPSDISIYLPLTGTAGTLSLTQTTGAINITSAINLPTTNLTLTATEGSILTNLPTTAITAADLTLNASGNIGSSDNHLILSTTGTLTLGTTNSLFLGHPTNALTYLAAASTATTLSLTQTTGDITITSVINLPTTNLTLTAQDGSILTTLSPTTATITAADLTLTAAGNIGSSIDRFILTTTGTLTINAGTNSVFLAHPTDISTYFSATITSSSLRLAQTTGDITITSAINFTGTNLILIANGGSILTTLPVSTDAIITAADLTLTALNNIGSLSNPFVLRSTTDTYQFTPGNTSTIFLAHTTDVLTYFPFTLNLGFISLTQTTGDINITSPISLFGTNLTLTASAGSILTDSTDTTNPIIRADTITFNVSGNIGSSSNPLFINVLNSLILTSGSTGSIFLTHPTDISPYLSATITSSSLSLTQTTGDINITSAINLPATNLTLTAQDGSILTTLSPTTATITADELTLNASDTIGSVSNPLYLITTTSLTITPDSTSNTIYLSHPTDVFSYLTSTLNSNSLSLTQTTGDINITSAINLPTTNLTLTATAGAILTTLTTTAITANNLALNAAGNIGSSTNPFILTTTGSLTINAGTNSVFLAHPSDVSIYLPLSGTAGSLSLTQTTGDINITAPITLTGANLTLTTSAGSILTTLTTTAITANDLTLNASGNIGSSDNHLVLSTTGTLTLGTTNSLFLGHPTNALTYLAAASTATTLSLTQTTGDITISSAIDFSGTNLTLTAQDGSILTTLSPTTATITADELTLNASDTIGSVSNPLYLITTTSLTITPDSTSNTIYLSHPTDVFSYLTSTLNSNSLSLTQTTGDINITDPINEASLNLELRATGTNASINIQNNITADTLTLFAINTITTTSSNNLITAPTINLQTMQGDIGTTTNRIYLSSGENNPPFTSLTLIALTTNSNIYIRANQNSDNTAFTAIRQQVIDNNPNPTSTYTITIFNDASQAFSQDNDLRFTIPPPRTNNDSDSDGFFASITDIILSIFGDDCDDDDSDFVIVSDVIQILCF